MTNVEITRTSRSMKDTVLQGMKTINEIYSNLIFSPEEQKHVNLKVITPTSETEDLESNQKLVHYHVRHPNVNE